MAHRSHALLEAAPNTALPLSVVAPAQLLCRPSSSQTDGSDFEKHRYLHYRVDNYLLTPEENQTLELGVEQVKDNSRITVVVFQREEDNFVDFVSLPNFAGQY